MSVRRTRVRTEDCAWMTWEDIRAGARSITRERTVRGVSKNYCGTNEIKFG